MPHMAIARASPKPPPNRMYVAISTSSKPGLQRGGTPWSDAQPARAEWYLWFLSEPMTDSPGSTGHVGRPMFFANPWAQQIKVLRIP